MFNRVLVVASAVTLLAAPIHATSMPTAPAATSDGPDIHIEDVDRFYGVYNSAGGLPTADQLQHDYLDAGSHGLHTFAKARSITGASIATTLAKRPDIYTDARRGVAVLPQVRLRLKTTMYKLAELYPDARFLPVTIAIGRGRPVGTAGPDDGVMIGLEALCGIQYMDANVEDRFVHVIAHEYIHVQQSRSIVDDKHPTVLELSVTEGAAEFLGEMISGGVANPAIQTDAKGHETEIETAFVSDEDKTDLSAWLFNGSLEKPGDLGYWVGYRIVKSYYQHATDKTQAIRDILEMSDPKAFLAKSGWHPGIVLQ